MIRSVLAAVVALFRSARKRDTTERVLTDAREREMAEQKNETRRVAHWNDFQF